MSFREIVESIVVSSANLLCEDSSMHPKIGQNAESSHWFASIIQTMQKNGIVAHLRWFLPNYGEYATINKVYVTPSSDINDESIVYELFLEKDTEKTTPIMVDIEDLKKISQNMENKYMERTVLQNIPKWFYNGASDFYSEKNHTNLVIDDYTHTWDSLLGDQEKLNMLLKNAKEKDDIYKKQLKVVKKWEKSLNKAKEVFDADEKNKAKEEEYNTLHAFYLRESQKAILLGKNVKAAENAVDNYFTIKNAYMEPSSLFAIFEFKEKGMPTGWYMFDGIFITEVPETKQKFYAWTFKGENWSKTIYTTTLENEDDKPINVYEYTNNGMRNISDIIKVKGKPPRFSFFGDFVVEENSNFEYKRNPSGDKDYKKPATWQNVAKITFVRPYGEVSQSPDIGKEFYLTKDEIQKLKKIDFYPISKDSSLYEFLDYSYDVKGRNEKYFIAGYNDYFGYLLDAKNKNSSQSDKIFTPQDVDKIEKNRIYVKTEDELFREYIDNNPYIFSDKLYELGVPARYTKIGTTFEDSITKEKFVISSISLDKGSILIGILPKSPNGDSEEKKLRWWEFQKRCNIGLSKKDMAQNKLERHFGKIAEKDDKISGRKIAIKPWFIPGYGPVKFISGDDKYAKFDAEKAAGVRVTYERFENSFVPLEENLANRVSLFFDDEKFDILLTKVDEKSRSYLTFSDITNSTPIVLMYAETEADEKAPIVCTISDVVLQDSEFKIVFNSLSDGEHILVSKEDMGSLAKIERGNNIKTFAEFSGIPKEYFKLLDNFGVFFKGDDKPFRIDEVDPIAKTVEISPIKGGKTISMAVQEFNSKVAEEPLNRKILDFFGEAGPNSIELDVVKKYLDKSQMKIEGELEDTLFFVSDFGSKIGRMKKVKLSNDKDKNIIEKNLEEYSEILKYNDLLNSDETKRIEYGIKKYKINAKFAEEQFYVDGLKTKYTIADIRDGKVKIHWSLSTSVVPNGAQEYEYLSIDEFKKKATFDEPSSYFWKKQNTTPKQKDGYNSVRTDRFVKDYEAVKFLIFNDIHPAVWETKMPVVVDGDLFIIKKIDPISGMLELVNITRNKDARTADDNIVVSADEYIDNIIFGDEENRINYEEHLKDWVNLYKIGKLFDVLEEKEKQLAKSHNMSVDDAIKLPDVQQELRNALFAGVKSINGGYEVGSYMWTKRQKRSPSYKTPKATTITYDKDAVKHADSGKTSAELPNTPEEWFNKYNIDTKYLQEPIKILGNNYYFSSVVTPKYNDVRGPIHFVFKPEIPKEIFNNPFLANSSDIKKAFPNKELTPGELLGIVDKME